MTSTNKKSSLPPSLVRGAVWGVVAAMAMAMFAMITSVSYQHHGFFTPLFHISALVGSPKSMMTSVAEAMAGNRFWFAAGPAVVGLMIHMITGAAYGMGFDLLARRIPRTSLLPVGVAYGVGVFVVSSFIALPLAAAVTGSGVTISDMASMVGWATFAIEHMMFGVVLGAIALRRSPIEVSTGNATGSRSAILSS